MSNTAVIDEIKTIWNPLASKPAPHIAAAGDGVSLTRETPRPSPSVSDASHYSCRCNTIRRATPAQDRCVECRMPLTLRYDDAGRLIDPNIHVRLMGNMIADQIIRLHTIIDESRPHLTLADVSHAMRTIDEARRAIKLHDLGETPLVLPRDYGLRDSLRSSAQSAVSTPEGT